MGKTRVHLLAKELGIETKDLIAQLDKLGMRGRKAQSAMEDDEVARVRAALVAQEKPQVHVGEEKVIARVVKTEEEGQGSIERARPSSSAGSAPMSFAGAPAALKWHRRKGAVAAPAAAPIEPDLSR